MGIPAKVQSISLPPRPPAGERRFLTPDELLKRWEGLISKQTLTNWRQRGGGPSFTKLGGRVVYFVKDIETYEQRFREPRGK